LSSIWAVAMAYWPGSEIVRSMQTIVRGDDLETLKATRSLLVEMIGSGVTHIVLASTVSGRAAQWVAEEIIGPVVAELPRISAHE
jgi:hypothetical protein